MLRSHLNAIESVLLAQSNAASNAGHPNLRGGPREWFIQDFLRSHLPGTLEIGQGEIIDPDSKPRPKPKQYRGQVDIVLYRKDLPVISLSKYDSLFLAEGVMAALEVKSDLRKPNLINTCKQIIRHKKLKRPPPLGGFDVHLIPKHIVSYVVAYGGPKRMSTVAKWLPQIRDTLNCKPNEMPEMIIVLGKGAVWRINAFPNEEDPKDKTWAFVQQAEQNLFTLFVHMLSWMGGITPPPDLEGYYKSLAYKTVDYI